MAIYTPTLISNLALAYLGDMRIASFDERGEAARTCREFYPHALQSAFEDHPWTCFKRTWALQLMTPLTPLLRWKYAYSFPPNCASVQALGETMDMEPEYNDWDQTADFIAANANPLYAEYTATDFSEAHFPGYFAETVANRLGILVAPKLQGTLASAGDLQKRLDEKTLPRARGKDSLNQPARPLTRSFWSERRFGTRGMRYR